jgi:MFS family permease
MLAVRNSPLAAAGVVVAALSGASFRMVGPIYGTAIGLEIDQIAYFLAAFVLGGALAQIPIGWLADKYDRRKVLIWLSVAAVMSCLACIFIGSNSTTAIFLTALFFGMTTFPIFSVASAHAHDFVQSDERVELSAALMFYFALGAIASPLLASFLINRFGPSALFVMIASGHVLLIIFGLSRMRVRPTRTERTPYIYAPRTSFIIERLLKRLRDKR